MIAFVRILEKCPQATGGFAPTAVTDECADNIFLLVRFVKRITLLQQLRAFVIS
jgi:hypothetical protein